MSKHARLVAMSLCTTIMLSVTLARMPLAGQEKKPVKAIKHMEVDLGRGVKMKLVYIEPGKFIMGSPKTEEGSDAYERPQHEVEITRPFYMGVYEVTQAEYQQIVGKNPSYFSRDGAGKAKVAEMDTSRFPVECVSWEEADDYCRKLSKKTGKMFDLPTEAEWEYACRAGTTGPFHYGKSLSWKQANFRGDLPYGGAKKGPKLDRTTRVGSYEPNAFGLYDMHGNVQEWCKDWGLSSVYYPKGPVRDPQGPEIYRTHKILRGGSWWNRGTDCRSASRDAKQPDWHQARYGFRVVVRLP